jgi:hypothetical protein
MKNKEHLDLLIRAIQSFFFQNSDKKWSSFQLSDRENRDFQNLCGFHGLHAVVAGTLELAKNPNQNGTFDTFFEVYQRQALANLNNANQLHLLIQGLADIGVEVLPYKGLVFSSELYDNNSIRVSGDTDILIRPKDLKKTLEWFFKNDFSFHYIIKNVRLDSEKIIDNLLKSNVIECQFYKNQVAFDLHWGLYYPFFPVKVPYESFFEGLQEKLFYGKNTFLPSLETQFWTIIVHHGTKENWLRLKHLLDLAMFFKKYKNELDWDKIILKASDYKVFNNMIMGVFLVQKYFDIVPPQQIQSLMSTLNLKTVKRIEAFWLEGKYWNKLFPRLSYERIFMDLQDEGFDKAKYFKDFFKAYSIPNELYNDRFLSFGEKYYILNGLSKIFSYVFRKFR